MAAVMEDDTIIYKTVLARASEAVQNQIAKMRSADFKMFDKNKTRAFQMKSDGANLLEISQALGVSEAGERDQPINLTSKINDVNFSKLNKDFEIYKSSDKRISNIYKESLTKIINDQTVSSAVLGKNKVAPDKKELEKQIIEIVKNVNTKEILHHYDQDTQKKIFNVTNIVENILRGTSGITNIKNETSKTFISPGLIHKIVPQLLVIHDAATSPEMKNIFEEGLTKVIKETSQIFTTFINEIEKPSFNKEIFKEGNIAIDATKLGNERSSAENVSNKMIKEMLKSSSQTKTKAEKSSIDHSGDVGNKILENIVSGEATNKNSSRAVDANISKLEKELAETSLKSPGVLQQQLQSQQKNTINQVPKSTGSLKIPTPLSSSDAGVKSNQALEKLLQPDFSVKSEPRPRVMAVFPNATDIC